MLHEMLDIAVKRKEETLVDHSKHIGTLINLLLMEMRTYLDFHSTDRRSGHVFLSRTFRFDYYNLLCFGPSSSPK